MSRGAFYTEEENNALMELLKDNESEKYTDIAAKAIRYKICPGRTSRGLAQQLAKLTKKDEAENETDVDPEIAIAKKEYDELDRKYKSFINTVIGTATLFEGPIRDNLKLNYKAILEWIWTNEPKKANARIEELGGRS